MIMSCLYVDLGRILFYIFTMIHVAKWTRATPNFITYSCSASLIEGKYRSPANYGWTW
jgi:hypothetical protein